MALARQKQDLDLCHLDLASTQKSYQSCIDDTHPEPAIWQSPIFAVSVPILMLFLGFAAGNLSHH